MKIPLLLPVLIISLVGSTNGQPYLVINEFMARNDSFITDANGDYDDWIEIYNNSDESVDVSNMFLTDNMSLRRKWQFPDNAPETIIPPHGYLLIWADNNPNEGTLHTNFKLGADGEQIALYNFKGDLIDSITFGPQQPDVSYGRTADGDQSWRFFAVPSPGASNTNELNNIIISEIMYHPGHIIPEPENILEEYIELFNPSSASINLSGWRFSDGVDYLFPDVILDPGEYIVVAAEPNIFRAKYPGLSNVVGGWNGKLSNSGEAIELENVTGETIDRVFYSDEGDWAIRELGPPDYGHRGWLWSDEHDGGGQSLELINFMLPNEYGQNWSAGNIEGGTPGADNSIADYDIAPLILDVTHFPIIPWSFEPVTVSACIIDELTTDLTVTLYYRQDGDRDPHFTALTMFDDGMYSDINAGDGIYEAEIPGFSDGTIIEFYIEAYDAESNIRTWPAPSIVDGELMQVNNLLYQVNDSFDRFRPPGGQPIYYLIMTENERAELEYIGSHIQDAWSRAQFNGTFISIEPALDETNEIEKMQIRYQVGIRNRGAGSRTNSGWRYRNNYHINFPNESPWNDVTALIINNRYGYLQLLGSVIFQAAGLPAQDAYPIQLRVNSQNLALTDDHMFGSYIALENFDEDFARKHFPDDSSGNAYLCANDHGSDLGYKGENPELYSDYYEKNTNAAEYDFNDLINMVYVLNYTPQETFVHDVNLVINIEQWLRYLAMDSLIGNREGGLSNPKGDDYALYCGKVDRRFLLVPHDLDTILGQGDTAPDINRNIFIYAGIDGLEELLTHPDIIPLYYNQFDDLISTVFSPEQFDPLVDEMLSDWVPKSMTDSIKQYVVQRNAAVRAQILQELINQR